MAGTSSRSGCSSDAGPARSWVGGVMGWASSSIGAFPHAGPYLIRDLEVFSVGISSSRSLVRCRVARVLGGGQDGRDLAVEISLPVRWRQVVSWCGGVIG